MVKDFKIILSNASCYPGSNVEGKLIVSVDKPKKYKNVVVRLLGRANVLDVSQRRDTNLYRVVYVDVQADVWNVEISPTGDLPIGEYHFPFHFQLPHQAPPSFTGLHGDIKYEIEAKIFHSGLIESRVKSKHVLKAILVVRERTDILRLYTEPRTESITKRSNFLFFKFDPITATVNVPRTGFSLGDILPVSVHVNNQSSRDIHIKSALHRVDTFTPLERRRIIASTIIVVSTLSPSIRAGQITSYENGKLIIPTAVPTTMRSCSCISVEYFLHVTLKIPMSPNKTLKIPIVVANEGANSLAGLDPFSFHPQGAIGYIQTDVYNGAQHPYNTFAPNTSQQQRFDPYLPSYDEAIGYNSLSHP